MGCSLNPIGGIGLVPGNGSIPATGAGTPPQVSDVQSVAQAFLDGWQEADYAAMYALLSETSQAAISEEEFHEHYLGVAIEAAMEKVDYQILSMLVNHDTAQVSYRVTLTSLLVGEISRDTVMDLRIEGGRWRIQWDDTLVIPELKGGNFLLMDREGYTPSRANIYDRNGLALVAQADATALGLYADEILPDQRDKLFSVLAELTGTRVETIQALVDTAPAGAGWYIPVGQVSADRVVSRLDVLSSLNGLVMRSYKSRYYFDGGIAPHVVGYVSAIQPEELEKYQQLGYQADDRIGRSGLEAWGEQYLAGRRGGALYVFNAQGQPVTRLAELPARPSQAIYTTLDKSFQIAVQKAISNLRGAIVVLERDTGRVLAMVSSPGFDPNAFEPVNFNSATLRSEIFANPDQPLINRATQGLYPLGSVFKIITMAAALESKKYTPQTTYQCGYFFEELEGLRLYDWTYDYFVLDGRTIPSGLLTLPEGLIRSCNPFFFHIGLDLYSQGLTTAVSDMARSFGLGEVTGILGLEEEAGQMPDPTNPVDATNQAIGQGEILVTPLQVAMFAAAVGNGGTLYRPQIIERIAPPDGQPIMMFSPQVIRRLPVSPENLKVIQDAMVGVIRNEKPRGTAWHRFTGLDIAVAGKTGTAQSGQDQPHAWFVGYTFEGREGKPDIAIAVVLENIGEGSVYAAPIFRRIVEIYFSGQPLKLYDWETGFNLTATPTFLPFVTPGTPISP